MRDSQHPCVMLFYTVVCAAGVGGDKDRETRTRRDELQHRRARVRSGMPVAGVCVCVCVRARARVCVFSLLTSPAPTGGLVNSKPQQEKKTHMAFPSVALDGGWFPERTLARLKGVRVLTRGLERLKHTYLEHKESSRLLQTLHPPKRSPSKSHVVQLVSGPLARPSFMGFSASQRQKKKTTHAHTHSQNPTCA